MSSVRQPHRVVLCAILRCCVQESSVCVLFFSVVWLLIIRSKRRVRMLTGIKDLTKSRHCELSREEGLRECKAYPFLVFFVQTGSGNVIKVKRLCCPFEKVSTCENVISLTR